MLLIQKAQCGSLIVPAYDCSNNETTQPSHDEVTSPDQSVQLFAVNRREFLSPPCHLCQQPFEVRNVTITPTINHRHCPQQQQIRDGRDWTV